MFVLRREGQQMAATPVAGSAGVSPVGSDAGSSASESPVPSEASYGFQYTSFKSLPSIHESGLPDPPPLRPKPVIVRASGPQIEAILRGDKMATLKKPAVAFHDYENYFYI